jgi:hypothetical protein
VGVELVSTCIKDSVAIIQQPIASGPSAKQELRPVIPNLYADKTKLFLDESCLPDSLFSKLKGEKGFNGKVGSLSKIRK